MSEHWHGSALWDGRSGAVPCYIDGAKVREIDPLNFIREVNGVDYLADVRKAIGK